MPSLHRPRRDLAVAAALAAALLLLVTPASLPAAETAICDLLTSADVAPLVGNGVKGQSKPSGMLCTWGDVGSVGQTTGLMVTAPNLSASQAPAAFQSLEQRAMKNETAHTRDEPGLGDKAFSEITSYGAVVVVLKGGRILQLQFTTGRHGTEDNRSALLTVAKKASAKF